MFTQDRNIKRLISRRGFLQNYIASKNEPSNKEVFEVMRIASIFTHELTQPLCAINNYAAVISRQIQSEDFDKKQLKTNIQNIEHQSKRANNIINNIRQLLKVDNAAVTECDLNDILENAAQILEETLNQENVSLIIDIGKNCKIHGERGLLEQVFINLFKNSIDAIKQNGQQKGMIRVTSKNIDEHIVEIYVSDNGKGFKEVDNDKLFETFYTTKDDGLGIGLPICLDIIKLHGGDIRAAENGDEGAKFILSLQRFSDPFFNA